MGIVHKATGADFPVIPSQRMKVLIDTDPGTDDYLALLMALTSPTFEVVGLTTVGGNASLAHTTRNALRMLEYLGMESVPVARGASLPLVGKFEYAYGHHGAGGLTVRLPRPIIAPVNENAEDFMARLARENSGALTLLALGPLTNVANAITRHPDISRSLEQMVVMGGAFRSPGNVTPFAEFNIFDDPEAAAIVFASPTPMRVIGLDVCDKCFVTAHDHNWLSSSSKEGSLAARVLRNWFQRRDSDALYHLCDPLAVAAMLAPDLVSYELAEITVATDQTERRGQTTAVFGAGTANVALEVDAISAKKFIHQSIGY